MLTLALPITVNILGPDAGAKSNVKSASPSNRLLLLICTVVLEPAAAAEPAPPTAETTLPPVAYMFAVSTVVCNDCTLPATPFANNSLETVTSVLLGLVLM